MCGLGAMPTPEKLSFQEQSQFWLNTMLGLRGHGVCCPTTCPRKHQFGRTRNSGHAPRHGARSNVGMPPGALTYRIDVVGGSVTIRVPLIGPLRDGGGMVALSAATRAATWGCTRFASSEAV